MSVFELMWELALFLEITFPTELGMIFHKYLVLMDKF